jgi:hypothetical protein
MAKVAKKSATKVAKKASKSTKAVAPVAKKAATKAPNPLMEKLIALMLRKDGATIQDFQGVDGFNIPSMAVVKAAQRAGYEASASKKPGERTVYKAVKQASS